MIRLAISSVVLPVALSCLARDRPAQMFYRSFTREPETSAEFARMGIPDRCFFVANTLNSSGNEYCQYASVWKKTGVYDWTPFDEQVADVRKASPDGRFLCMVDLNTPPWLTRWYELDSFSALTHLAANPDWHDLTKGWLTNFLAYAEGKYGDVIGGYVLSGGRTSEWYEYNRGLTSRVKNEAWRSWCAERELDFGTDVPGDAALATASFENLVYDPKTEGAKIAYWKFHNGLVSEAILDFAHAARTVIPEDRQLGVFFGYFHVKERKFGTCQTSFGHLDYDRVFAAPELDFFIAPGNYSDRPIGGASGSQLIPGSVLRHGKRFLHEIDFRPHTMQGFLSPWRTSADDIAGNTREWAFALVNHAHCWWFDMWGHFYDDPALKARIARLKKISDRFADDVSKSTAEVLLVADPESIYGINERDPKAWRFGQLLRNRFGRTGLPFDVCSFADLKAMDLRQYKSVCLYSTILITPARAAFLKERICRGGRQVLWCYAPGLSDGVSLDAVRVETWAGVPFRTPGVSVTERNGWQSVYAYDDALYTPEKLRALFVGAGCTPVSDLGVPVFANERLVAVHCATGGVRRLRLNRPAESVTELLSGKAFPVREGVFDYEFETPDTRVFEVKVRRDEFAPSDD